MKKRHRVKKNQKKSGRASLFKDGAKQSHKKKDKGNKEGYRRKRTTRGFVDLVKREAIGGEQAENETTTMFLMY